MLAEIYIDMQAPTTPDQPISVSGPPTMPRHGLRAINAPRRAAPVPDPVVKKRKHDGSQRDEPTKRRCM